MYFLSIADSTAAIAENDQQFPSEPWFLTDVTSPNSRKSYLLGRELLVVMVVFLFFNGVIVVFCFVSFIRTFILLITVLLLYKLSPGYMIVKLCVLRAYFGSILYLRFNIPFFILPL